MPITKKHPSRSGWLLALAGAAAIHALPLHADAPGTQPAPPDAAGIDLDTLKGKESTEGVYVRDSATAIEKLALAMKMQNAKEWNKSADLYQEVMVKYAGRVVPSKNDKENKIYQYTSINNRVQGYLVKWPAEGLEVYRARFEAPAQALLDSAGPNDVAVLNKLYSLYFVTEAAKQAGIRLIDIYLETGEFHAAAWLGDRLLTSHPGLIAERPPVLYRTALAYYFAGDQEKAKDRLEQLKTHFAGERGIVRGKDVILAESLSQEFQATVVTSQSASPDSWPMPFGDPSRGRISTAEGRPGAHLYDIPLSKPAWTGRDVNAATKDQLQKQYEDSIPDGQTLGILPVTDRGELFFQDGQRLYGVNIESGVSLPGWNQTYADGAYVLKGTWGSSRAHQLSVAVTDHEVLAVMGQPDLQARLNNVTATTEARLVCLDRQSGREKWVTSPSQLPESARDARSLQLSGSPLAVGDSVLVIARGSKAQFEDCYVLAFDISSGKLRWFTYIASASTGQVMWGGMGSPTPDADNASHLAYANGRVYVQTNLGALAALDAYTGAVAWLDIYPTGRVAMERFNQFGGQNNTVTHKPWVYNPVIVQESRVFTLPTSSDEHGFRNLMIYDAETGEEKKRIDVKDLELRCNAAASVDSYSNLETLLGVVGDEILLSSEKGVVCLNWKNYVKDNLDISLNKGSDHIISWINQFGPIRGRGFIAKGSLYIPLEGHLCRLSLATGKDVEDYPKRPLGSSGDWEDPEGPGNVLATNDYVVIAGAKSLNVYTDLSLAKTKLDRELVANPADATPRLRYAEVMFVAGEPEAAMTKLDEAAKLLGGLKTLQQGENRDRFFRDALTFADKLAKTGHDDDRDRSTKLFDRAGAAAHTPVQQVHYRVSRAQFAAAGKDYTGAVQLYQEILADPRMRPVPMASDNSNSPQQADGVAEKAIAALLKDHPAAYASFEQAAGAAMEQARADKKDSAGKLLELSRTYPNSTVAGKAMLAAAEAYEAAGDPRHSIRVLRDKWFKYPAGPTGDKVTILESMARNYLALAGTPRAWAGDLVPIENMEAAATSLARANTLAGDSKLEKAMKLPDGKMIEAGTPIAQALDSVRKYHGEAATKVLPDLHVMIRPPRVKAPKAFLAADPARDVIPNIKALVLPLRDFARADRVVAYGIDGTLNVLAAGQLKPLATSHAITEEPRSCAWVGDHVLVWGASQLVKINGSTGEQLWKVDLHGMQPIEVVHVADNGPATNVTDGRGAGFNGGRQVVVFPGQGVVLNGRRPRPGVVVNPQPAAVAAGTGEELIEVHPVGDHVLMTTTSGRILSAELATGQVAWQTRLSDRPVDRLVANEDFAVVRISDEAAVRLAAFDTATGQMRCTQSWVVQSGTVPVNLALAADGTLVYTMPDQLCLKDLYKPWGDASDKETKRSKMKIFDRATQPDQLVIAEGRILAFAVQGTMKFVHLFSLETAQPILLHYHAGANAQEVESMLLADRSEQVGLRVVGSQLYVFSENGAISYNLDRPGETWTASTGSPDEVVGPHTTVRDQFISKTLLVLVNEPPHLDEAAQAQIGGIPAVPPPPVPGVVPPVAPAPIVQPNGAAGPIPVYKLQLFARYPVSDSNPREAGKIDYNFTVSDPSGIAPTWQAAEGGLYFLTGDHKLHILRGNRVDNAK